MLVSSAELYPRLPGELELVPTEEPDDGEPVLAAVADNRKVAHLDEPELEGHVFFRTVKDGPLDGDVARAAFRYCQVIHTPS